MYSVLRKLLFCLDPETSHHIALKALSIGHRLGLNRVFAPRVKPCPIEVMGIQFPNPVGMAAGLDKNGDYFNALGDLGFGSVEIGTVTPRPQAGNPRPRLFRLPEAEAIINRMGFNNLGVDHLVEQVKQRQFDGVLGINIGKNKDTPEEKAADDYIHCLEKVYPFADYVTINISSPNTPGLRNLQFGESLDQLLSQLKQAQAALEKQHNRYVPIAVKIAPDMDQQGVEAIANSLLQHGIDGVIATNTTLSRDGVEGLAHGDEAGGLSGAPLTDTSTQTIASLAKILRGRVPIIGVGGIVDGESAADKIRAGASLVQIYSGFIYHGPDLIAEAADAAASVIRSA